MKVVKNPKVVILDTAKGKRKSKCETGVCTVDVDKGEDNIVLARELTAHCPKSFRDIFTFPHPLNAWEVRAKGIFALIYTIITVALDLIADIPWAYAYLLFFYVARLLSGPLFSWESWLVLWISPKTKLKPQYSPGPPKRFALFCGTCFILVAILVRFIADSKEGL